MRKLRAGVIGATGMVGQTAHPAHNHPYFQVSLLAASSRSAGKTYKEALAGRWKLAQPMPADFADMTVVDASDIERVASLVDFVFCAVDMKKEEIKALEEAYAKAELPVVSNNSANRWTPDVPMLIPEINQPTLKSSRRKGKVGDKGLIVTKPNCSIQSYVPMITPCSNSARLCCQYISGSIRCRQDPADVPEMNDNVNPYIGGEEEKSEQEPLRIWGSVIDGGVKADAPKIHPVLPRAGERRASGGRLCKI